MSIVVCTNHNIGIKDAQIKVQSYDDDDEDFNELDDVYNFNEYGASQTSATSAPASNLHDAPSRLTTDGNINGKERTKSVIYYLIMLLLELFLRFRLFSGRKTRSERLKVVTKATERQEQAQASVTKQNWDILYVRLQW